MQFLNESIHYSSLLVLTRTIHYLLPTSHNEFNLWSAWGRHCALFCPDCGALKLNHIFSGHILLTSATGQDVASLPAGRAGLPHAVMFPCGLPSVEVCAAHLAGLKAMAAAGSGARRPRAYTPTERAGLCGAVLQRARPSIKIHVNVGGCQRWAITKYKYGTCVDFSDIHTCACFSDDLLVPTFVHK